MNVPFEMEFHAFVSMDMAVRTENLGNWFPFSKASIYFLTTKERYFALTNWMTPWSIAWVIDVVFRERKISSIKSSAVTSGWPEQLSIIKAIFLFLEPNFCIISLTHSSNSSDDIQPFGCECYSHL